MNEVDLTNLPTVEKVVRDYGTEYRVGDWYLDADEVTEEILTEDIRSFVSLLRFVREENGLSDTPPGD